MSLTRMGPGPVWASGGEMVTMSLGSAVSGISKALGGRLSRRLTLTVADAMFARDWWEGTEGVLGRDYSWGFPSLPSRFPHVLSLSVEPYRGLMWVSGPLCPHPVTGWGLHRAPCSPITPQSR